jgi:hypothetical protein
MCTYTDITDVDWQYVFQALNEFVDLFRFGTSSGIHISWWDCGYCDSCRGCIINYVGDNFLE